MKVTVPDNTEGSLAIQVDVFKDVFDSFLCASYCAGVP